MIICASRIIDTIRLKARELELERKTQDQRGILLRKMEENNLKIQRKTEWVGLEEKRLHLNKEEIEKEAVRC